MVETTRGACIWLSPKPDAGVHSDRTQVNSAHRVSQNVHSQSLAELVSNQYADA